MAGFNFIEAGMKGYAFAWRERVTLFQMAAMTLAVKIISLCFIVAAGQGDNLLRQGLVMTPAYFLEGGLAAHAIRMALYNERSPFPPEGDAEFHRRRLILAAAIVYTLTKLIAALIVGLAMGSARAEAPPPAPDQAASAYAMGIAVLIFAVWAFRFLWLYVPVALGYPLLPFLKRIESFSASFYILGLWMMAMAPFAFTTLGLADMLRGVFPWEGDTPSESFSYAFSAAQGVIETIVVVIASVGMAHGFREMMARAPGQK